MEKKRLDAFILAYMEVKGYDKSNKAVVAITYKRCCRPAKELLELLNDDAEAIACMEWLAAEYEEDGLDWSIETVMAHYPDYVKAKDEKPEGVAGREL